MNGSNNRAGRARKTLAVAMLAAALATGCSASGGVGTEGDGVTVQGDVDAKDQG